MTWVPIGFRSQEIERLIYDLQTKGMLMGFAVRDVQPAGGQTFAVEIEFRSK